MTAWIRRGRRMDIDLAVAMEIANLYLMRAGKESERQDALAFNRRLWGVVRHIALCVPGIQDRDDLLACADQSEADGAPVDTLLAANLNFAQRLAGREATQGALKAMLEDWRSFKRTHPRVQFGGWLLDRLDMAGAVPMSVAA